ncbi:polysaccharide biosynthesis protein [Pseudonocardia dioxanivorans CB1190]|uniref:Polysaccharide biosynthesis protein n=2 Tax=Pseudonocardia dioxanivorans TaxID=240495 RepID=F4CR34_PSEUX|nr:polysaccharide biosynthesis protein [Pseudonocardia dioxanivorans CB1190]
MARQGSRADDTGSAESLTVPFPAVAGGMPTVSHRSQTVRSMARRVSWGLGDQAVSSLTNFLVGVYVARSLDATSFGVFSLVWVTYGVLLNVSRGLGTDPLTVRHSGEPGPEWREAVGRSSGTALVLGIAGGLVGVVVGLLIGGSLGNAFVGLGIVLPALLLQDSWRFAFFAVGRGQYAFVNDLVWAAALVPGMVLASHHHTVSGFVLAWGGSSAVAAIVGAAQARILPRPAAFRTWVRLHRDLGYRYLVENVSTSGASQLRAYGLGAIAGLAAVGTVRGAELLIGPFLAVLMGLSLVSVPEAARILRRSPRRLPQFCLVLGSGQALAAMLWGCVLLFVMPASIGHYFLGDVWDESSRLIVPITASVMSASFLTGAAAGLRALGAARRSLRAQLVAAVLYLGGGLAGAAVGGAYGSAWGVVLAQLAGAGVAWWQLRDGLRDHMGGLGPTDRAQDATPPAEPDAPPTEPIPTTGARPAPAATPTPGHPGDGATDDAAAHATGAPRIPVVARLRTTTQPDTQSGSPERSSR